MTDLKEMRKNYERSVLHKLDLDPDPMMQFRKWFEEASAVIPEEVNAMTLCTLGTDGMPKGRTVLLKEVDEKGFVFYTNYNSHKGREIAVHPKVTLLFFWGKLERQVRIEGVVEKIDRKAIQAYFDTRPFGSRLGAIASPQSEVVPDREYLENIFAEAEARFKNIEHPAAPENWGGYRVLPIYFEFWQGRQNRLHDRMQYRPEKGAWIIERLAP